MIKMGCFECGNDVYCQHCGCHLGYDALVAERDALRAALEQIAEGRFSLAPAPDYVTNPTPSPQDIARAALK